MPSRRQREEEVDSPEPATQRRRTTQQDFPDDEDAALEDDDEEEGDYGGSTQDHSLSEMVKKLVRLALACEYQRRPIRKADIAEKVLGSNSRQFRNVFNAAQLQLRHVFGMEMTELPAKEKVTVQQRRAAQKSSTQSKPVPSWILTSTLPPALRTPTILTPPSAPTPREEAEYTGVYSVLVSYITLSGGSVSDSKLTRVLRRLRLDEATPVRDHRAPDKMLAKLVRDGYLVRNKDAGGAAGEDDVTWTVGPRGKTEVGDEGVRGLTKVVFGEEEDEAELDAKIARSLGMVERPGGGSSAAGAGVAAATGGGERRRRRRTTGRRDDDNDDDDDDDKMQDDDDADGDDED